MGQQERQKTPEGRAIETPVEVALHVGKMKGGGVEATMLSYVQNIDRSMIHYTVIVDEDSTVIPSDEFAACGTDLVIVPPYQRVFAYHKALYSLCKEKQFDVFHTNINTLSVFPLFAAWRAGIPVRINHNHNTAGKGEWKRNIAKYILRPFGKVFATELCGCSEYAGRWMFGKKASITVMPNAIDFNYREYTYRMEDRIRLRRELDLEKTFVIGHVGRFIPQKNHPFLIEVFSEIAKRRPDSRLLVIGTGADMKAVQEKAAQMGLTDKIVFAGQRHDVAKLYSAMDVLLLPSLYEGKPLVPMEAQYSGLCCIVSDCVTKEIVISDELVHFVSLNEHASHWAEVTLSAMTKVSPRDTFEPDSEKQKRMDNVLPPEQLSNWYVGLCKAKGQ